MGAMDVLSTGLKRTFNGENLKSSDTRSDISLTEFEYESTNSVYNDQFIEGKKGHVLGSEVAKNDGTITTRAYAGSVINNNLKRLLINEDDILEFLGFILVEYSGKSRLDKDFGSKRGNFEYVYKVLEIDPDVNTISSIEEIYYNGTRVFVHRFLIQPIEA